MQLQCPNCGSRTFQVHADVRRLVVYNYAAVLRTDLHEWEDDLDEACMEPCEYCGPCRDGEQGLCESLSPFEPQRNRELMTKPLEQRKLTVELENGETLDEKDLSFEITEIECDGCSFSITDKAVLAEIQRDWR